MKRAIVAIVAIVATVAVATAQAEITAKIPTNAGGYIRLTDTPCEEANTAKAYTVAPDGHIIAGCWGFDPEEGLAWIKYANGESYFYVVTDDMLTDYGRAKAGKANDKINM